MEAPLAPRSTLSAAIWAAAEHGDAGAVASLLDSEGYPGPDCRSRNQSTLLHCAAKHGNVELARLLLQRGAYIDALDFGAMRRMPLHWACKGGHVAMVELLVDSGAHTKADGRSWSKLVQGSRCGFLIPKDSPTESVESVCRNNAVRLALRRPAWEPLTTHMWPQRFKDAVRLLLLATCAQGSAPHCEGSACAGGSGQPAGGGDAGGAGGGGGSGASGSPGAPLPLPPDLLQEVLRRSAYPISHWM